MMIKEKHGAVIGWKTRVWFVCAQSGFHRLFQVKGFFFANHHSAVQVFPLFFIIKPRNFTRWQSGSVDDVAWVDPSHLRCRTQCFTSTSMGLLKFNGLSF